MFPVSFAAVVGVGGGERGLPDKTKQRLPRKLGVLHIKPDIFHVVSKQICILYLVFQQTYSQKNKLRIFLSDRNKKKKKLAQYSLVSNSMRDVPSSSQSNISDSRRSHLTTHSVRTTLDCKKKFKK